MKSKTASAALIVFCLTIIAASPASAQRRDRTGTPGRFDYYVLSLSWSPEYCANQGRNDRDQCLGPRRYAFVVHGLWPQFERDWPENCSSTPVDEADVPRMLDLMPNRNLIRHEWRKHGTCDGASPAAYFDKVRKAWSRIRIPSQFANLDRPLQIAPGAIEAKFLETNRNLTRDGIAVVCSGRYLREVRICLDRNLNPRPCGSTVRDACQVDAAVLRPVR
jgi:ribonuclease T2